MDSSTGLRFVLASALALLGCASRPPVRVDAQYLGPIGSRDVAQGERTFRTLCAACHAGRVNPAGYHWSAPQMRHQIREGNALMPALPPHRLSDDRVEAVLAYLSTIGAIDGGLPLDDDEELENESGDEEPIEVAEAEPPAVEEPIPSAVEAPADEPAPTPAPEPATTPPLGDAVGAS